MIPSLSDLQRLFPIGPIEFDDQTRRELASIVTIRNMIFALRERESNETTYLEVQRRVDARLTDKEGADESAKHAAQITELADLMERKDSSSPGLDYASVQDQNFMLRLFNDHLKNDNNAQSAVVLRALAATDSRTALHTVYAGFMSALKGLMHHTVIQQLYRQHSGVRFPIQHFVYIVIDPGPGGRPINATINGYSVDVLRDIGGSQKFKAPDTAEEFLRGHSEAGVDNASNPT